MSSVSFKTMPVFLSHTPKVGPDGTDLPAPACSRKNLYYDIARVFRQNITDIKKISPYESPAFSNYPGGSNLLYLPGDIYSSGKTLYQSLKQGDFEDAQDSATRLVGAPANFMSAAGTVLNYGVSLKIIPASLITFFLPLSYVFGVILCTVEGTVDSYGLNRQRKFANQFDFNLLSKMKKLLENFNPTESPKALKEITQTLKKHPEELEKLFGKEQAEQILALFSKIQSEVEARPLYYRKTLRKYAPALKEVSRHLLIENLSKLQREYLELTPIEVASICEETAKKHEEKNTPMEEQLKDLEKTLQNALFVKKKNLARRVQPWMANEAGQKANPLIKGLIDNHPKAIQEGLNLSDDINTQMTKKTLVHILGIFALVIAAISLMTLICGCPGLIPYILIGIATTIALSRMVAFSVTLDTRGWHVDWSALIPDFLKSKKQETERQEEMTEEFRTREVVPLNQAYHAVLHQFKLNQAAMRV